MKISGVSRLFLTAVLTSALLLASCGGTDEALALQKVEIFAADAGPLVIEAFDVEKGDEQQNPPQDSQPTTRWASHKLRVKNTSTKFVYLDDPRTGALAGDDKRMAAGLGCGVVVETDGELITTCTMQYAARAIPANGEIELETVSLYTEQPGLQPLEPGRYEFKWALRYRDDRPFAQLLEDGPAVHAAEVTTTYVVN